VKIHQLLLVSALSLSVLAGCSTPEPSAKQSAETPATTTQSEDTKQTTPEKAADTKGEGGFAALENVVSQTQTATKAGDFAKAKAEFGKFEASWAKVEDGVKAKSKDSYKNIEESVDKVNKALKASKPDAAKVSAELASLQKNLASVAK
jgi:hypothetical protein